MNKTTSGKIKIESRDINSEDIRESRLRIDKVIKIFKESPIFTSEDFQEALRKISRERQSRTLP